MIGFAQGATIALELARSSRAAELSDEHPSATEALHKHPTAIPQAQVCSIVVAYAAQLARPLLADERVPCSVHLIHGDLDHRVPAIYGHQAYKSLKAAGADVTWDLIADTAHTIGQDAIIVGTMRAMQRIFRGRSKGRAPTLH
ncbi:MAG: Phospholipase/Carboxylesterase [Pseudomonadota bacterium]